MLNFLKRQYQSVAISSTFNADLKELKTASLAVQRSVGHKIAEAIGLLSNVPENTEGAAVLRQYGAEYKRLRHAANNAGATSGRDPDYAFATIMEAIVISSLSGNLKLHQTICDEVLAWLDSIELIRNGT